MQGKTTIAIAHRISTIKVFIKIFKFRIQMLFMYLRMVKLWNKVIIKL